MTDFFLSPRRFQRALVLVAVLTATTGNADFIDDFTREPEVLGALLAPDGKHIAVIREIDGKRAALFYEFPNLELTGTLSFPGDNEVGRIWWVNNERILASVALDAPAIEGEVPTGELFAINFDGTKAKHLFGLRAGGDWNTSGRTQHTTNEAASGRLLHPLPDRKRDVLIEIANWSLGIDTVIEAAYLNVYNGRITNRFAAPTKNAQLVTDSDGNVRFSYSTDGDQNNVVHLRDPESGRWSLFSKNQYGDSETDPITVADDGRLYVSHSPDGGPYGIYLMDPQSQALELVYRNEVANSELELDGRGRPYAVTTMPDRPRFISIDKDHPISRLTIQLEGFFPQGQPHVVSATDDNAYIVIALTQDTKTPEFYLYDKGSRKIQLLFDALPWLDDNLLGNKQPITVTARDGKVLHGYLTVPRGAEAKNLPLIMVPHGGPHGPRDVWGFDWFEGPIHMAGYAMLQINYRGSGGYGPDFESSGFRQWSGAMQDDLTDTVRWAIKEGIADPERICIFGWSYGGYAAVMSIEREPDLYQCSVAGAGVYDQDLQFRKADFARRTRFGKNYINRVVGPTLEDRRRDSPVTYVDRIKTPLMLIHGDRDQRVPIDHMYALEKALKAAGKPKPERLVLKREGHSPRNPENRKKMWRKTLAFFKKHIGPGIKVPQKDVAQR